MNDRAAIKYILKPYDGRIIDFIPTLDFSCYLLTENGWGNENVITKKIKSYPSGMIYNPFVEELAEEIKWELEKI